MTLNCRAIIHYLFTLIQCQFRPSHLGVLPDLYTHVLGQNKAEHAEEIASLLKRGEKIISPKLSSKWLN